MLSFHNFRVRVSRSEREACGIRPSLRRWLRLLQRRRLRRLSLLGLASSPRKRDVLVDVLVQRNVALGDGVGAAGLVLVDELVHVAAEDVLGVLVHVHLVASLAEDSRAAGCAAADAHARKKLKGRDDRHREAPAADGLAAQPRAEEARESGVDERDDAADAGQALDAREAGTRDTRLRTRRLRTALVALRGLRSGG